MKTRWFAWNGDKATGKLMLRQQRPLPLAPQTDAIFRSVKDNYISPADSRIKIRSSQCRFYRISDQGERYRCMERKQA